MKIRFLFRDFVISITILLVTAGFTLFASSVLAGDEKKQQAGTDESTIAFTIRGRIVTHEAKPLPGLDLYCWFFSKGVAFAQVHFVDRILTPTNPYATSDDDGYFEIKVSSQYLKKNRDAKEFTVGRWISENAEKILIKDPRKSDQALAEDIPFGFKLKEIKKMNNVIDLGTIQLDQDGKLRLKNVVIAK